MAGITREEVSPKSHPLAELQVDNEMMKRFNYIVEIGQRILGGTAIVDSARQITADDVNAVIRFLVAIDPSVRSGGVGYRSANDEGADPESIGDWSRYNNTQALYQHLFLASEGAAWLTKHLRQDSSNLNPEHMRAAALLHDLGRMLTHIFYTNELVARKLYEALGIRNDITSIVPDESLMQTNTGSMQRAVDALSPAQIIIRLADEFGKPFQDASGQTRTIQCDDFLRSNFAAWAERIRASRQSGIPSDDQFRRQMLDQHMANVEPYFKALNSRYMSMSGHNLQSTSEALSEYLTPMMDNIVQETIRQISTDNKSPTTSTARPQHFM